MILPDCSKCGEELKQQQVHTMHATFTELAITNRGMLRPLYDNIKIVCADCTEKEVDTLDAD